MPLAQNPLSSGDHHGLFEKVRTLVIKVGTRVLIDDDNRLDERSLAHLVDQISQLQDRGYAVVLVTSGAVGVGMGVLGFDSRPTELAEKQACAAIGQIRLMQRYADLFQARGKVVAQILLTGDDFKQKTRFNNIRKTVSTLLGKSVIPIVNENDTVAVDEIKVGDNDKLSADVTQFLEADLLVILSDEEGLFDKNPKKHADAKPVPVVARVDASTLKLADTGAGSKVSVGGMKFKLIAIRQVTESGTPAMLMRGADADVVGLFDGRRSGTLFLPHGTKIARGKRWLAYVAKARGTLTVDAGAARVLRQGKSSLLPAGIRKVSGHFTPGDFVEIVDSNGERIGRGRISYPAADVQKIKGQKSSRILDLLGRNGPDEVIHRDRLVIYGNGVEPLKA